jgi:hypothetical protein
MKIGNNNIVKGIEKSDQEILEIEKQCNKSFWWLEKFIKNSIVQKREFYHAKKTFNKGNVLFIYLTEKIFIEYTRR